MADSGLDTEAEGTDFEELFEGSEKGSGDRIKEGIVCVVENVGQRRHPLVEDDEFVKEYRKMYGHPPPFRAENWAANLNPKKLRSSGKSGTDIDLSKRRQDAEKGISHVVL